MTRFTLTWTDEMTATAAGMKRAGLSCCQIADRLGVDPQQVKRRCYKVGARSSLRIGPGAKDGKPGRIMGDHTRIIGEAG